MKKYPIILSVFIFVSIFLVFGVVWAGSNERIILSSEEVHNGLYFASGETVIIDGIINGDAYVVANQVIINGAINGDLFAAGNSILINGRVSDDVRAVGSDITISGQVGKNLTLGGRSVIFLSNSDVTGSVMVAGQTVSLLGSIGKEVRMAGQHIALDGFVGGDVNAYAASMAVQQNSQIKGSLIAFVEKDQLFVAQEASIEGVVEQREPATLSRDRTKAGDFSGLLNVWFYLSFLLLGIVAVLVMPRQSRTVVNLITERPWRSLGWGLVWLVVIPIAVILLFITLIGIVPGLLIVFVYLTSLILSQIFAALLAGHYFTVLVLKKQIHLVWQLIVGLLIYQVLTIVPFLGGIVFLVGTLLALGALAQLLGFGMRRLQAR